MTLRLYFEHDLLTAPVELLTCVPRDDLFAATLHATPFHPQGGGQPSDTGWIGEARVLRVTQEGEQIVHYLTQPLTPGSHEARVDEEQRLFNSRMHSAGHLIGHFVQSLGWIPIKAHHWPGEGRVQFKPTDSAQEVDAQTVEFGIEQWIAHDLPRLTSLREGAREIGFGELPAYGCGGTHVRSLKDLGTVTIASLSQKKGTLSVHYSVD